MRRLVDSDQWRRLGYGVYVTGPDQEPFARAWASHLMAGDGSALGGSAALALRGIGELPPGPLDAWVAAGTRRRSRPGLVRVRRDSEGRLARRRGVLPLICVEDALLDSGATATAGELVGLTTAALRLRRTTLAAL